MRTTIALIALAGLAVAALAFVVLGGEGSSRGTRSGSVALVGDSLNVGIEPYLGAALPGWRITTDDLVGRSTAAGLDVLRESRSKLPAVVVVSLGTNDPVGEVAAFATDVDAALRTLGKRCVVWSTLRRDSDAYASFNDVLRAAARERDNLVLVDWAAMVDERPELLADDGVHGTEDGYAQRAAAVADAVRSCPNAGGGA